MMENPELANLPSGNFAKLLSLFRQQGGLQTARVPSHALETAPLVNYPVARDLGKGGKAINLVIRIRQARHWRVASVR